MRRVYDDNDKDDNDKQRIKRSKKKFPRYTHTKLYLILK